MKNNENDFEEKQEMRISAPEDLMDKINIPADLTVQSLQKKIQQLSSYIKLLNNEIRRYHAMLPMQSKLPEVDDSNDEYYAFIAESPLLQALEDRLQRLEADKKSKDKYITVLKDQNSKLMKDTQLLNSALEKKIVELMGLTEKMASAKDSEGISVGGSEEAIKVVEAMKQEQTILIQQLDMYKDRNKELEQNVGIMKKAVNDMKKSEADAIENYYQIKKKYDIAANELLSAKNSLGLKEAEASKYFNESSTLTQKIQSAYDEIKNMKNTLSSSKRLNDEQISRKDEDIELLHKELDKAIRERAEFQNRVGVLERVNEEFREREFSIKRELNVTKSDMAMMVKTMESMEQELNVLKSREAKVLDESIKYQKEITEALLQRDKSLEKTEQNERILQQVKEQHEEEIALRQSKSDSIISSLEKRNKAMLAEKDEVIKELSQSELQLKLDVDKLSSQVKDLTSQFQKSKQLLEDAVEDYNKKLDGQNNDLVKKEESKSEEATKFRITIEKLKSEKDNLERQLKKEKLINEETTQSLQSTRSQFQALSNENKTFRQEIMEIRQSEENSVRLLETVKKQHNESLSKLQDNYSKKIQELQESFRGSDQKYKLSEAKSYKMLKMQQEITEKWKAEHTKAVTYFEGVTKNMHADLIKLKQEKNELLTMLPDRVKTANIATKENYFERANNLTQK